MSDYLERWFRELGVPCERQTVSPGRDNLLARYEAPGARTTILFDAHQDTVPTDGMTIDAVRAPRSRAGRLYGRGSCDIKGGMAAMLIAFARLVRERPAGSASVIMACTVDEEFTHTGSSRPGRDRPRGRPGDRRRSRRGSSSSTATRGRCAGRSGPEGSPATARRPHLGDQRHLPDGRASSPRWRTMRPSSARSAPHPVLGPPSLSVGRIEGGQSVNVVPDWCEIEVDRRVIPGETAGRLHRPGRDRALRSGWASLDGGRVPAAVGQHAAALARAAGRGAAGSSACRDAVARGHRQHARRSSGVPYGTDAGPLGERGLPCLVFGPGDIAQAHTKDEWIELDQVRLAAEAYFEIALGARARE